MHAAACLILVLLADADSGKAAVDAVVQPLLRDAPGGCIVVGILDRRGPRVHGYGDAGAGKPPDGGTLFEIGSVTKVYTAVLLAQMARDGKVRLADPVQRHLPPELVVPKRGAKEIALEYLATHTSGLPRMPSLSLHLLVNPQDVDNPYSHYGMKPLAKFLALCQLDHDPGAQYEYSNLGVGLLGLALVHRAGAASFEELVVQEVCKPLGLKDTCITPSAAQRKRLAPGYGRDGKPTSGWDFETLGACGALRSTADDQLRFLAANLGKIRTPLRPALADCHKPRHATTRDGERIGLGWLRTPLPGSDKVAVWHNGGTGGYRCYVAFREDNGTGVVVLSNRAALEGKVEAAAQTLLKTLEGDK